MVEERKIGSLATPPLILGGNVFGWTADADTSFAILDGFVAGGGRMIDTADAYSAFAPGNVGGESETIIGQWLKRRGRRDDVLISTKVGKLPGEGGAKLAPGRIAAAIDASLRRLGTDYVDLYIAHQDDEDQSLEAVVNAFDTIVRAGKVREIGASNFSADRLASSLGVQKEQGGAHYVSLQNHYNLLERAAFEGAVQSLCVDRGIAMTPYYGLASGYLTGKYRDDADLRGGARDGGAANYMKGDGPRVLTALDRVAEQTGASLAQIALAWLIAQPGVTAPIASATSVKQLDDILGALTLTLSAEQLAELGDASTPAKATA